MHELTDVVLGMIENPDQRHKMEKRMQHGMNVGARGYELLSTTDAHGALFRRALAEIAHRTQPIRAICERLYQVFVRGFHGMKICIARTVEELYAQAARRLQRGGEFRLTHEGRELYTLEDNIIVDILCGLHAGDPAVVRFRIEGGTCEWTKKAEPGDTVGAWRQRALTQLKELEREHAQSVHLDGAMLDEDDILADWIRPDTVMTLQ
jgi:hypothetical protein